MNVYEEAGVPSPLQAFEREIANCHACPLRGDAPVVVGNHATNARIMLVLDIPTAKDVETRDPIATESANTLFKNLLVASSLRANQVYVTHLVKCNTTKKDPRLPSCMSTCFKTNLQQQINLLKPHVVFLTTKQVIETVLYAGTPYRVDSLKTFLFKTFRRRGKYGETRFTVIPGMRALVNEPDEGSIESTVAQLTFAKLYAEACDANEPPPAWTLTDVREPQPIMRQTRNLFREENFEEPIHG